MLVPLTASHLYGDHSGEAFPQTRGQVMQDLFTYWAKVASHSQFGKPGTPLPKIGSTLKFAKKVSVQKMTRHLKKTAPKDKSYFDNIEDAQKVLDAYNRGDYRLISENVSQNTVVIEIRGVSGTYVNTGNPNGLPDLSVQTNKFMIQSTANPKVVPVNPKK